MRPFVFAAIILCSFAIEAQAKCEAMAKAAWTSAKQYGLTLEAHALGPKCAGSAVALLVVDGNGAVQWSTMRLAAQNAMFQDGIKDSATMKAALAQWLKQGLTSKPKQGRDLPDWKAGQDQAEREGEFGFYAATDTSREFYLDVRKQNQPLFCFVQGMESTSCIAAAGPDNVTEIGGFTFPG